MSNRQLRIGLDSPTDPEDGMRSSVERILPSRAQGSKIDGWESLWRALFPEDQVVPSPRKHNPVF
ncbi:hypothetical protein CMUS01_05918 [Colletotrichum musicola]|uniref:Uncharacterized protein n=1 Tax=Colletotrichum musicola TaxID=2175873 RepID=A0A8H6KP64_9PEZI|nr:hypothetical protein CMUS01_05918 [Colletotrichum musicola]